MLALAISLTAAVIPSAVILWWFYSKDKYPEPPAVVMTTFVLGVLSVVPVIFVALPVMLAVMAVEPNPLVYGLVVAFLGAAVPEEFFKFCVIRGYSMTHDAFDEPMDGLVYGVAASLGFATLENVLYVLGGGLPIAVVRALTAVPMHATVGAIMGYYCGQAHFFPDRRGKLLFRGFAAAVILHGLYDFPLLWLQGMAMRKVDKQEFTPVEVMLALVLMGVALLTLMVGVIWAWMLAGRLRTIQEEESYRTMAGV
jgi:RsiW-degrading membrane proteinase PrsW (M82 family)